MDVRNCFLSLNASPFLGRKRALTLLQDVRDGGGRAGGDLKGEYSTVRVLLLY